MITKLNDVIRVICKKAVHGLVIFLFLLCGLLSAQNTSVPDWENLLILSLNTLPPHVTMIPFDSEEKVIYGPEYRLESDRNGRIR